MNLLAGLFDKEQMTHDTIQDALKTIATELGCNHTDFFVMMKAKNEKFSPAFYIYKLEQGKGPVLVREITIKEILGEDEEG